MPVRPSLALSLAALATASVLSACGTVGGAADGDGGDDRPLVIIGGARETAKPTFEMYIADDSTVNPVIGEALRQFLPTMFPGKYESGREPEMEWVRSGFHPDSLFNFSLPMIDRDHGLHENGRSVRELLLAGGSTTFGD